MRNRLLLFIASVTPLLLALAGPMPLIASAQTTAGPNLVVTWRAADSSVPSSYPGKALPGPGAPITASVEVVRSGGLANLSNQTIYWYLDNNLVGGGVGKQTISFVVPAYIEIASLRAEIPNYPTGPLINTAHIQMENPEAVIVAPYADRAYAGSSVSVQAVPYFFSASQLNELYYQWTVNGQAVTAQENPQDLTVNLGSGASGVPLAISLTISMSGNSQENAGSSITLTPAS